MYERHKYIKIKSDQQLYREKAGQKRKRKKTNCRLKTVIVKIFKNPIFCLIFYQILYAKL